jgi:hypothetical protein
MEAILRQKTDDNINKELFYNSVDTMVKYIQGSNSRPLQLFSKVTPLFHYQSLQ